VRNVKRILELRRLNALTLADLEALKVATKRARQFLITADSLPRQLDSPTLDTLFASPQQLFLFEARTGEF
jgi:predicted DNA-binding helix-hairpin-helix protein